ncbi:hypothetical protein CASFOL_031938 [Castilleja foliolosa]|uniref:Uncharacterized protein n=1 Tax=Castilleja foliolosa TaxID=1961234 RepID=A0ABD3C0R8_9LAMI
MAIELLVYVRWWAGLRLRDGEAQSGEAECLDQQVLHAGRCNG